MKDKKIVTRKFELEISVNIEDVQQKFPNYHFNFSKIEDFINFIVNDLKYSGGIDLSKEAMENFGYSVIIRPKK